MSLFGACFGDLGDGYTPQTAGIDITKFAHLVQGPTTKPMTPQQAWKLLDGAQGALQLAIANTPSDQPGRRARLEGLLGELAKIYAVIGPIPDPVLEPIAQGVRDRTVQAFVEFNQTAQGRADLENARDRIMVDIADNVGALGRGIAAAAETAADAATALGIGAAILGGYLLLRRRQA